MNYLTFADKAEYPVAFLVPRIQKKELLENYFEPFGMTLEDIMVMDLHQAPGKKKTPMAEMRAYINEMIMPYLIEGKTKLVAVTDAEYFKAMTKCSTVEANLGYVMDCELGDFKVIYVPNYKALFYDPIKVQAKINQAMNALTSVLRGNYEAPGANIIHFAEYPQRPEDIEAWLERLLNMNCPLTIDLEGFDLKHNKCGIGTISFAWNKHEGIAFSVDYIAKEWIGKVINKKTGKSQDVKFHGKQGKNLVVRALLKRFFQRFLQKAIYHNIAFDAYVLIYQLFMDDILDQDGLLEGLDVMLRNWDCSKLIAYLATNSCSGNKLGLKEQAHEFAGNYAMTDDDIKDIRRIPLPKLLEYNLVDSMSTWYVIEKRRPQMIADQQEDIYTNIFKPATLDIVQMQLTGMPVNMKRVLEVEKILQGEETSALNRINSNPLIQRFIHQKNEQWVIDKNLSLKKKIVTIADATEKFNPNSPDDMVGILFGMLALPVLSRTKTKQPSADGDSLEKLVNHTKDPLILDLLKALKDFKDVNKILGTFVKALKGAALGSDGWYYLFGNFNLGGTVSGRLSSSKPNLQNLPAGAEGEKTAKGRYGKLIKSCFQAPPARMLLNLEKLRNLIQTIKQTLEGAA